MDGESGDVDFSVIFFRKSAYLLGALVFHLWKAIIILFGRLTVRTSEVSVSWEAKPHSSEAFSVTVPRQCSLACTGHFQL